jgi:glycosyltransferase involved in cell wall biosynthesis
MRILLSAFACDPIFGSDEEVGWQWARELANRGFDVTVLTRRSHQNAIELQNKNNGECSSVKFEYIDMPSVHVVLRLVNRRNHLYYYLWQYKAYLKARALHAIRPFDLVHHVTWVSFRQPSFMGGLGIPFYFGPVAGGDEVPRGYAQAFSRGQYIVEVARGLLNRLVVFDPLMRLTFHQASRVFFTSQGHLTRVPEFVHSKSQIELGIASNSHALQLLPPLAVRGAASARLLFVGRCIGWKGMDLGLLSFARILERKPDTRLTIIGDGVDRARWESLSVRLGIAHAIDWRGWLAKSEVIQLYSEFDLLFYPSLRDSGGFVVLEALQAGLPVVCYQLGGPGVVVNESCGMAVVATDDQENTVQCFADAVLDVLQRAKDDPEFALACRRRVGQFTWDALIDRIYAPYINSIGLNDEN